MYVCCIMYVCTHICVRMYVPCTCCDSPMCLLLLHMYVCMYTYSVRLRKQNNTLMCTYACMAVHTYTRTHTYIEAYTHKHMDLGARKYQRTRMSMAASIIIHIDYSPSLTTEIHTYPHLLFAFLHD